jgi:ribosomal protein S18 acetylase RimI-like enzyme
MSELETSLHPAWMNQVVIRNARKEDLPALEWDGEYSHFRVIYQDAFRRSQHGLSVLWVAELAPKLIAQVFIQLQCDRPELCNGIDRAYLYGFRVRPAFRSFGLGSTMLRKVERDLVERGFRFLTLNVARENLDAIRLYQRRGFHIVAPEPGRWQYVDEEGRTRDVHEPAWRMEKVLDAA